MLWIFLVLLYGILKGAREILKKKALEKNSTIEVLFVYTLLSFLIVLPDAGNAAGMELRFYFYIAAKSFVIFLAWMCSFKAIRKMPISLYGVLDLSRVMFATLLGVIVLHEVLSGYQVVGLLFVSAGLLLLKYRPRRGRRAETEQAAQGVGFVYVVMAFASCMLNALSGLLDKILMRDISSAQLQFWYMLFLVDAEHPVCDRRQGAFYRERYAGQPDHGDDAAQAGRVRGDDPGGQISVPGKRYDA